MPGNRVLILVVMEDGLVHSQVNNRLPGENLVLILVVMEDGLVQMSRELTDDEKLS